MTPRVGHSGLWITRELSRASRIGGKQVNVNKLFRQNVRSMMIVRTWIGSLDEALSASLDGHYLFRTVLNARRQIRSIYTCRGREKLDKTKQCFTTEQLGEQNLLDLEFVRICFGPNFEEIGNSPNRKLPELEIVRIGYCQNRNWSELEFVRI